MIGLSYALVLLNLVGSSGYHLARNCHRGGSTTIGKFGVFFVHPRLIPM
jgi:hypothetical protein